MLKRLASHGWRLLNSLIAAAPWRSVESQL